ncbi:MAG: hypothetical protein JSR78_12700 [Proteobacteria bacterium]|nr:hypothetical protein [Pseudomonadota bacterium]
MADFKSSAARTKEEIAYHSRHLWVRTKDLVGLPRAGLDRSFFISQLARKIRSGEIGSNVRITAAGKTDGAGAQALAKISAMAFAATFNREYVHVPFRKICHAEGPPDLWTASWEQTFNFGHGYKNIDSSDLPIYPLGDFLKNRTSWAEECAVQLIHYQNWTNANTWAYASLAPELREKYYLGATPSQNQQPVIALHIRRGDVSETQSFKTHFTPNGPIHACLTEVLAVLKSVGIHPLVQIFSQGKPDDFKEFFEFDPQFYLDRPAIESFRLLIEADVLLMARSAFSYVAALLSDGIKLYDPFQEAPLPDWIVRDATGSFDTAQLRDLVERLPKSGERKSLVP